MQELLYICKIILASIWIRMVPIDINDHSGIHRFSHLDIPSKHQYFISIIILMSMGRFFDTIIDVDY